MTDDQKEKARERNRRYRERNRTVVQERGRQWRLNNAERSALHKRNWRLRRVYGIEPEQYDALLAQQDGRCALCGAEPNEHMLHVDHCHTTGKIRALLCVSCNTSLHSVEWHLRAIDYLVSHTELPEEID